LPKIAATDILAAAARPSERASMATLQPWHDFFMLSGTAAATLLGLIFVAASIAATIPNEKLGDMSTRQLWILPIIYAFLRVLVVSAIGVIPGQTGRAFGVTLSVLVTFDLARMVWVARGMTRHHHTHERLETSDWLWYVVYPTLATVVLAATAVSLTLEWPFPPVFLAVGLIGHLVVGVHNAYELADWLATRQ
jgi:hypothetical protein